MTDLYKNIKKRRLELQMTQSELARKVGYADKGMISRIENGKVDLSQSQIFKFAEALEIEPSVLMGWDEIDFFTYPTNPKDYEGLFLQMDPAFHKGDREEALARTLYELYQKASPEIQQAVDVLLKVDKHS